MNFCETSMQLLQRARIKFSRDFVTKRMKSHPDYPSLVSLTDLLDELMIPYSAVIADKKNYEDLQYPLLAHFNKEKGEEFIVVSSIKEFEKKYGQEIESWSGISVMVKSGYKIQNSDHNKLISKEQFEKTAKIFSFIFIFCTCCLVIAVKAPAFRFGLSLLSICGIAVSISIMMRLSGKDFFLAKQLCGGPQKNDDCDKVIKSSASISWNGFGIADLSMCYFLADFLFSLFASISGSSADIFSISLFSGTLAVMVSLISIWYQGFILKKWCRMCLVISSVIWLQFIVNVLSMGFTIYKYPNIRFSTAILFVACYLVSFALWLIAKPAIIKTESNPNDNLAYMKLKRNPKYFFSLLKDQRKIDPSPSPLDIFFGNKDATTQIIMVCNPYCKPCAAAHHEITSLLNFYSHLSGVTYRFLLNRNNPNDQKKIIALKYILEALEIHDESQKAASESPLDVWFGMMDIEKFIARYNLSLQNDWNDLISQNEKWCKENKIVYTPTIFVNGYQLPDEYSSGDLKLLIPQVNDLYTYSSLHATG